MRPGVWITVSVLFLLTLLPIVYKTKVLGVSFIPKVEKNYWTVELSMKIKPSSGTRRIGFPIPKPSERILVKDTKFDGKGMSLTIERGADGLRGQWQGKASLPKTVFYRVVLEVREKNYDVPSFLPPEPANPRLRDYLVVPDLLPEERAAVGKVEKDILPANTNRMETVKAIYYFIHEEVLYNGLRQWNNMAEMLDHMEADSIGKARLFTVISRRQGIPARTVGGILLRPDKKLEETGRRTFFYWNEVHLDNRWIPLCTVHGRFAHLNNEYLPLYRNIYGLNEIIRDDASTLRILAKQVESTEFSLYEYRREIRRAKSWIMNHSLYMLPVGIQSVFKILIMIPFGTLILVFFRNIIGFRTFGIFMPVLLALFFKETSYFFGMAFFSGIVALGLGERQLLKRLHLLAVPRLSIIITLVVGFLCIFALANSETRWFTEFTPALFPIVITTIFIERFSLTLEEEGVINTIKALAGTIIIATIAYWFFSIRMLQTIFFTHPETLFSVAALLILAGKYTGYRVSELLRFREMIKGRV